MSDMKDFVDASDFERWAKVNVATPDFSGTQQGLNRAWVYNDATVQRFWHCWRCARNGYMPGAHIEGDATP